MYELPKRLSATELLQSRSTHNLLAKALDREENLDDKSRIEYLEIFLSKQSSQTAPNIDTLPILETY